MSRSGHLRDLDVMQQRGTCIWSIRPADEVVRAIPTAVRLLPLLPKPYDHHCNDGAAATAQRMAL